jgi:tetratricopeptide (TPR) repeat protein
MRISRELLDVARKPGEEKSRAAFEGWLSTMRLLVRFEKWDEILDGKTLPDASPFEVLDGWRLYARGLARLGKGDVPGARAALESLEKESAWLREQLPQQKGLPLSGRQRQLVSGLAVAPFELRGRILAREGKADEAITTLRRAIEEEIKLGYSEPPIYPNPMEEIAGKTAISLSRWSDAEEFFRAALERDPGSGRAFFGLMLAQQGTGRNEQARESYARFVKAWARADADLSEMQRARENAVAHGYPSGKK